MICATGLVKLVSFVKPRFLVNAIENITSNFRPGFGFLLCKTWGTVRFGLQIPTFVPYPKVILLIFRARCGTLNCNPFKEWEYVTEYALIVFKIFK